MFLTFLLVGLGVLAALILFYLSKISVVIGPAEVGLLNKRFGASLPDDNPIALNGEAGYQAKLLMPGFHFINWPIMTVTKYPWVQVPAGEVGVVIAQVGKPLPIGAKSAAYKDAFGNFTDVPAFIGNEGQKGVQRPVLTPGTLVPMHPVAFLVVTKNRVYGKPVSPELAHVEHKHDHLTCKNFGLEPAQLQLVRVEPKRTENGKIMDTVGIVTTLEGDPLPAGHIAGRLGDFKDIEEAEAKEGAKDADLIEMLLGSKNVQHNNYQDFQKFLEHGGRIGLQHDPLLYGAYALNPFLVSVETVPMLVVNQGEVAVVKAFVGLSTVDTSGAQFKFGSLVRPGHRGIWEESLRTGKYPINPRIYQVEIVPTSILTLNWAEAVSKAHNLDGQLNQIVAKSNEGFVFRIDLQVQIHVPDTKAPRVISTVGTMQNLVNEVLQAAVGNHFRDKLQSMPAVRFIETRQEVQQEAQLHISSKLAEYEVETRGVYIQDVVLPEELVQVLTEREIANQQIETYQKQRESQEQRVALEAQRGTADMQAELARSKVGIDIKTNDAQARIKEADGEAHYIAETGRARGAEVEAIGLARAKAYRDQVAALGQQGTAIVNLATALSEGRNRFVPEVLVAGGSSGSFEGLAAVLMKSVMEGNHPATNGQASHEEPKAPAAA
jgi:regulator of protease activity HflC (stomatin/prohibitin superfamily)